MLPTVTDMPFITLFLEVMQVKKKTQKKNQTKNLSNCIHYRPEF